MIVPGSPCAGSALAPSIAQYDTEEILRATVDFAEKNDIMVHGHLAESKAEWAFTKEHFGCTPTEFFRDHGLLGDRFYYAHCIHLSDSDIELMAQTNTGVSSCPISNMYLSSGSCRVKDLLDAGVTRIDWVWMAQPAAIPQTLWKRFEYLIC